MIEESSTAPLFIKSYFQQILGIVCLLRIIHTFAEIGQPMIHGPIYAGHGITALIT